MKALALALAVAMAWQAALAAQQGWTCTGNSPQNWSCTLVTVPVPAPAPTVDVQKAILDAVQQMLAAQQSLLVVEKDTNTQIKSINSTFGQTLASAAKWFGEYVAPSVISVLATLKATGKL